MGVTFRQKRGLPQYQNRQAVGAAMLHQGVEPVAGTCRYHQVARVMGLEVRIQQPRIVFVQVPVKPFAAVVP